MPAERDHDARFKFAEAIARGATNAAAAQEAGLSERSAYRIKQTDDFLKMVEAARERLGLGGKLDPDELLAMKTLRVVAKDESAPSAARVQAARALLDAVADRKKPRPAGQNEPAATQKPAGKVVDLAKWRQGS